MYTEEEIQPEIVCEQEGLEFEENDLEPQPITSLANPWAKAIKMIAGKPEFGDVPVNIASKVLKPYWRQAKTFTDLTPEERFNWAVSQAQEQLIREVKPRVGKYSRTKKASVQSPRSGATCTPAPAPARASAPAVIPTSPTSCPPCEIETEALSGPTQKSLIVYPIKPRPIAPKLSRPKVPSPPTPTRQTPEIIKPAARKLPSRLPPQPIMRDIKLDPSQILPPGGASDKGFIDPLTVNSTRIG